MAVKLSNLNVMSVQICSIDYKLVTETESSSGWQLWYSLETLKASFNVSSEYQSCQPDDLSVSVV